MHSTRAWYWGNQLRDSWHCLHRDSSLPPSTPPRLDIKSLLTFDTSCCFSTKRQQRNKALCCTDCSHTDLSWWNSSPNETSASYASVDPETPIIETTMSPAVPIYHQIKIEKESGLWMNIDDYVCFCFVLVILSSFLLWPGGNCQRDIGNQF